VKAAYTTENTAMQCTCGFSFAKATLDALKADEERPYESFGVVRDCEYREVLRRETEVLDAEAEGEDAHLEAIARCSELVGSLAKCPACGRLVLVAPGGESLEFYAPEG
jgi:hypothetical protein